MNTNDITGIASGSLEHAPFYYTIPDKLGKFGFCVDVSGYGEGKTYKAQFCIIDTVSKKEQPNILIVCPSCAKESWYTCLMKGLGLEFKFIAGSGDPVMFFPPDSFNLLIADNDTVSGGSAAFEEIKNSGIIWDLLILDASGTGDGKEVYTEKLGMKTEKLLIFAPYMHTDDIKNIVSSLLNAPNNNLNELFTGEKVTGTGGDTPFALHLREDTEKERFTVVNYAFPPEEISPEKRIDTSQFGGYTGGGNIFEEYILPETQIYQKSYYRDTDAQKLVKADKKLEKFIEIVNDILNSDNKTAIVYFSSKITGKYAEKILSALYRHNSGDIAFFSKESCDSRLLGGWYETQDSKRLKLILAYDDMSEILGLSYAITHIINYELPDDPVVLQRRYMRRTLISGNSPEFIIFLDDNKLFDSRILRKVLAGNVYKAFRRNIPSENILFSAEGIEEMLADVIADIKYTADNTGDVGGSFDIISHFVSGYNIPPEEELITAQSAHRYAAGKLAGITDMLGVTELVSGKGSDRSALLAAVSEKIAEIRSGYSFFDDDGQIRTLPRGSIKGERFGSDRFRVGLKKAQNALNAAIRSKNDLSVIYDAVTPLSYTMKTTVLYNIWVYRHKILGLGGSYAEFIKIYNEGVS